MRSFMKNDSRLAIDSHQWRGKETPAQPDIVRNAEYSKLSRLAAHIGAKRMICNGASQVSPDLLVVPFDLLQSVLTRRLTKVLYEQRDIPFFKACLCRSHQRARQNLRDVAPPLHILVRMRIGDRIHPPQP